MITKEQFKSIFIECPDFDSDLYRAKINDKKNFLIEFKNGKVTIYEKGYPVFSTFDFKNLEYVLPFYFAK